MCSSVVVPDISFHKQSEVKDTRIWLHKYCIYTKAGLNDEFEHRMIE